MTDFFVPNHLQGFFDVSILIHRINKINMKINFIFELYSNVSKDPFKNKLF